MTRRLMICKNVQPGAAEFITSMGSASTTSINIDGTNVGDQTFPYVLIPWVVPVGVTEIDAFMVGPGGAGYRSASSGNPPAGAGGFTKTYKRNNITVDAGGWIKDGGAITVTQGETIYILLGIIATINGGNSTRLLRLQSGNNYTNIVPQAIYGAHPPTTSSAGSGGSGGSRGNNQNGGSDGSNGSGTGAGTGQGHTTRPFAEDGKWAVDLNLSLMMYVPFAGGGGGHGNSVGGYFGGGGTANNGVNNYGGGGGAYPGSPSGLYNLGGTGCVVLRWGF